MKAVCEANLVLVPDGEDVADTEDVLDTGGEVNQSEGARTEDVCLVEGDLHGKLEIEIIIL